MIKHNGLENPNLSIPSDRNLLARFRDGEQLEFHRDSVNALCWVHTGSNCDIMEYQLVDKNYSMLARRHQKTAAWYDLKLGEIIKEGDRILQPSSIPGQTKWVEVDRCVGMTYTESFNKVQRQYTQNEIFALAMAGPDTEKPKLDHFKERKPVAKVTYVNDGASIEFLPGWKDLKAGDLLYVGDSNEH
jgi:hypothetical protein